MDTSVNPLWEFGLQIFISMSPHSVVFHFLRKYNIAHITFKNTWKFSQIRPTPKEPITTSGEYAIVPTEQSKDGKNLTWKSTVFLTLTLEKVLGALAWGN